MNQLMATCEMSQFAVIQFGESVWPLTVDS